MILGAFNYNKGSSETNSLFYSLKTNMAWNGGRFNSLFHQGFIAGYFLNPDLPLNSEDFVFINPSMDTIVLMSGKIYNQVELLKTLSLDKKISQPELIALAFKKWGQSFVNRLNGDFAVCIYMPRNGEIFLYRDHLGVQPLSYTFFDHTLFFSSDANNLCKTFYNSEKINYEYLLNGYKHVNQLETLHKKVKKIPPGHYLHFINEKPHIIKYWNPQKIKINHNFTYEKILFTLNQLLDESIKLRISPKYKISAHLSGGLDSSLLAVKVKKTLKNQKLFYGYSYTPLDYSTTNIFIDERELVKKVARQSSIIPIFVSLTKQDYFRYLKNCYYNFGNFWEEKTREIAKKDNVNLIVSGWGGDEFISKSNAGINADLFWGFHWNLFFQRNPLKKPLKLFKVFLLEIIFPFFGIIDPRNKKEIIKIRRYFKKEFQTNNRKAVLNNFQYFSRKNRQIKFIKNNHLAERCERWFLQGYRLGIEYRYPFLDKRIVEFVLQIPSKFFFRENFHRIFIRDLSKGFLPEEVRWNNTKLDNVFISSVNDGLKSIYLSIIDEINVWKQNPDLNAFIDFNLLEKDLKLPQNELDKENFEHLPRQIVFFKMLHEFTKTYRSLPPTAE